MFRRKSTAIAAGTLFVITLFGGAGIASAHEGLEHDGGTAKTQDAAASKTEKTCPVTGEKIPRDSKITYAYKGKVYKFCCGDCIEKFKKDPEKYIGKVKENTAKGTEESTRPNHLDNR
jgi:YHS domain-containing protein